MNDPKSTKPLWVFYDGGCGMCHRAVLFALRRDDDGSRFLFSPQESGRFKGVLARRGADAADFEDTIVVLTPGGRLLARSSAVLAMLDRLGGAWGVLALVARIVPRPVRDWAYRWVARNRRRFFRKPPDACPVVPEFLRGRFDLQR